MDVDHPRHLQNRLDVRLFQHSLVDLTFGGDLRYLNAGVVKTIRIPLKRARIFEFRKTDSADCTAVTGNRTVSRNRERARSNGNGDRRPAIG